MRAATTPRRAAIHAAAVRSARAKACHYLLARQLDRLRRRTAQVRKRRARLDR